MNKRNLAIALFISVAAGIIAVYNKSVSTSGIDSIETSTSSVGPPTITFTPTYEGCGYMWAYHDNPKLSAEVDKIIRGLNPTASANTQLFGEDCVYADGHSTFGVMETDFYVRLPVSDLSDEYKFGIWIKQVMDVVASLPDEEIQGNKGFVEFSFIQNDTEQITVRVSINEYLNNSLNLNGSELFEKYHAPPTTPYPITPTSTPTV